jgi:hypothetical protein
MTDRPFAYCKQRDCLDRPARPWCHDCALTDLIRRFILGEPIGAELVHVPKPEPGCWVCGMPPSHDGYCKKCHAMVHQLEAR